MEPRKQCYIDWSTSNQFPRIPLLFINFFAFAHSKSNCLRLIYIKSPRSKLLIIAPFLFAAHPMKTVFSLKSEYETNLKTLERCST